MSASRLCVQYASVGATPRPTGVPRHYCYTVISASGQPYATSALSSRLPRVPIHVLPKDRRWNSTGRLQFHPPSRRSERVKLAPYLVLFGGTGILGYYLYGLYAKSQMWPPDVRSDLRAAIKARRMGDIDTAGVYYQRAIEKCLEHDDIQNTFGLNYRLMVAGIAIALGGAYEDDAPLAATSNTEVPPAFSSSSSPRSTSSAPSAGSLLSSVSSPDSSEVASSYTGVSSSEAAPNQKSKQPQRRNQKLFARLKQAYDAYETAFVILAAGQLDGHVWEHLVRTENRDTLRRLELQLLPKAPERTGPGSAWKVSDDSVQQETYYRLIQVSSHLSYLAGQLSDLGGRDPPKPKAASGSNNPQEPHSYEELEALHALFALSALQQGRSHGQPIGLSLGLTGQRTAPSAVAAAEIRSSSSSIEKQQDDKDAGLRPSELMSTLDAHGPVRFDYAYLLERAGNVFAKQGAVLQALHLYRSAADALVPGLTGEPESWTELGLNSPGTTVSGPDIRSLPVRETCQVAALVNNMANVVAGTSTPRSQDISGTSYSGTPAADKGSPEREISNAPSVTDHGSRTGNGQPLPDIARAKRLALAAARLVEVVAPREQSEAGKGWRKGKTTKRMVVEECELARMVTAFNIGILSEMENDKTGARTAYAHTRTLVRELSEKLESSSAVTEDAMDDLRAGAAEADEEALAALGRLQ